MMFRSPLQTVLSGSNYNLWVQEMKSFLIGRKLWRIITEDITQPITAQDEIEAKFANYLED